VVNKIEPESRKIQESTSVPTVSPMPPTTGVKSAGNPKLRKPTKEESLLRIDEGFRSGLSLRGFSEHEIEIVIGYLRSEILHPDRNEKSALEKAGAELSLDTDKARQLSEVMFPRKNGQRVKNIFSSRLARNILGLQSQEKNECVGDYKTLQSIQRCSISLQTLS